MISPEPRPESRITDRGLARIGFGFGTLAGLIPLVLFPQAVYLFPLTESPIPWWVVLIAVSACVLSFIRSQGIWRWAVYVGLGLPASIMLRVLYDWFGDPTSHSLVPYELGIGLLIGLPSAFLGAYVGLLARQLVGRDTV